jgi:hypothetical protein
MSPTIRARLDEKGPVGHSFINNAAGTVTGKTINDILATEKLPATDRRRMFASGAYGITFDVLREAAPAMRLTGNERMTPQMQDRIFAEFLVRRDLKRYLKDPTVGVDQAQYSAARQWASIAVPKNYRTKSGAISDGTKTFYDDRGENKANIPATEEFRKVLEGWHLPAKSVGWEPTRIGQ